MPQKTDESRLTRSRSQSTSVKVLDVMFTPVKVKSASRKKETEKLEESRLGKRYAVNPARKSYKIPKWRILFYIILCTAVKCKNWLSHNNLSILIYFETRILILIRYVDYLHTVILPDWTLKEYAFLVLPSNLSSRPFTLYPENWFEGHPVKWQGMR